MLETISQKKKHYQVFHNKENKKLCIVTDYSKSWEVPEQAPPGSIQDEQNKHF